MPSQVPSIRRDQLRKFLPDERSVREFEKVLDQIQLVIDNTANIATITIDVATNTANITTNATAILGKAAKNGSATELFSVANGTTGNEAINYSQALGIGQTWQDVTASRALGTNYTNSTGKPIQVIVSVIGTAAVSSTATVAAVVISNINISTTVRNAHSFIVPPGAAYSVSSTSSTLTLWTELR